MKKYFGLKNHGLVLFIFVGIIVFMTLIFTVNLVHYTYRLNADIGSETVLGKLIWETKQPIPASWYPSSELRLISTPNVAALFYGLTHNAVLAAGLACCFMTLGIVFSSYVFLSALKMDWADKLLMIFLVLMLPGSFAALELVYLFAAYYGIHVIVLFLTLGFYHNCLQGKISRRMLIILLILALLLGIQGQRGLLVTFVPLAGIEALRVAVILARQHRIFRQDLKVMSAALSLAAVSYLGTRCPFSIRQNTGRNIRQGLNKLAVKVLPDVRRAIGFDYGQTAEKVILIIFCGLVIGTVGIFLWQIGTGKEDLTVWPYLVLAASPVISILAVAFTTMESTERYYFLIPFLMALTLVNAVRAMRIVVGRFFILILIVIIAVIHIARIYLPVLRETSQMPPDEGAVIEYLQEQDIEIAYAGFGNAAVLTTLANNEIIVAPIDNFSRMNMNKWLSSTIWYVPQRPFNEKTAYIVTEPHLADFRQFIAENELETKIVETITFGKYRMFIADNNYSVIN